MWVSNHSATEMKTIRVDKPFGRLTRYSYKWNFKFPIMRLIRLGCVDLEAATFAVLRFAVNVTSRRRNRFQILSETARCGPIFSSPAPDTDPASLVFP